MRKWVFGCILFAICFIPCGVLAAGENQICVNGNLYDVTNRGSKVDLASIKADNLKTGSTLPQHYFDVKRKFGVNSIEFQKDYGTINEGDYAFVANSLNQKCNIHYNADGSYTWKSCPSTSQYNANNAPYTTYKFQKAVSAFKFDGNGNFYVDIHDEFNSTLTVRVVRNGVKNNEYDLESMQRLGKVGSGEIYDLNSAGLRLSFAGGSNVRLEFYIKPSSGVDCAGSYVGSVDTVTPSYADVKNPWKDSTVCKNFRNGYSYISTSPTNYKSLLVPECYKDTIDYFKERPYISESSIQAKIAEVDKIFKSSNDADLKQLQCHYHTDGSREVAAQTKTFIYNPSGSASSSDQTTGDYWAASCTETVSINYDQPKKVVAGTGFMYDATLTVTRKCTPIAIRTITKPERCTYGIECWGGPANHTGESGAGPNEEFDSCVNTCDGGKYTKDCIQKCYKKVYEKVDNIFTAGVNSYTFLDSMKAKQMAADHCEKKTPTSPNYCYTSKGWATDLGKRTKFGNLIYEIAAMNNQQSNCNGSTSCTSFHGMSFTYLNTCNSASNPTMCYEVYTSNPRPKCSDNPEEDYQVLKSTADKEYEELLAAIRKYEKSEQFEMSVIDSYKRDNQGKPLTTHSTSLENKVKVTGGVVTYPDTNLPYKETPNVSNQSYSTAGDVKSVPEVEVKKEYKIELPKAVIDQITGKESYVTNDYKPTANERDGGNKYYTDINSGTYNDFRKWTNEYSPLDERADTPFVGNNIAVVFKNIGTVQTSSNENGSNYTWGQIDLDCFYGILNKRYIECDDGVCDIDCEENDVCTGGLQYMFRQIDLTNMFPDRDPRWNWTYTSEKDQYGYSSEPAKVIDDVQNLGESVYRTENLDYNITITKENIRSIRRYNKAQGNYQNYDMDCTTIGNGINVCESKFLKNTTYVKTYSRNTELGSND